VAGKDRGGERRCQERREEAQKREEAWKERRGLRRPGKREEDQKRLGDLRASSRVSDFSFSHEITRTAAVLYVHAIPSK